MSATRPFAARMAWPDVLLVSICAARVTPEMRGRSGPLESTQNAPETLRDVLALQRLAQDFPDPDRARTLEQLRTAVAAHQHDRDVGPHQANLTGEIGADELRHRLIGHDDIEAPRCLAE